LLLNVETKTVKTIMILENASRGASGCLKVRRLISTERLCAAQQHNTVKAYRDSGDKA
jgi:hypothetical protein